jgi:hypothetical protein
MSELRKPYRPGNEEEIPAGLEYRPEMWDSALGLIENHEKVVFRRKLIAAAGILLLIALGAGLWDRNMSSDGAQMNHQEDVLFADARGNQEASIASLPESAVHAGEQANSTSTSISQNDNQSITQAHITPVSPNTSVESSGDVASNSQELVNDQSVNEQMESAKGQKSATEAMAQEQSVGTGELAEEVKVTALEMEKNTAKNETQTTIEQIDESIVLEIVHEHADVVIDATDHGNDSSINENTHEGINSEAANSGDLAERPIPLDIKQTNGEDSPLQNEPFAEGAPAPHAFSTEFMRLGQEPQKMMEPLPYALVAYSTDFKKPQGVIVNLKQKELLLPLQQFNVQVMLGTSILTHYGSRKRELALSPAAGVGVDYNFKRRLSFNAQLQYFSIKNIQRDRVVIQEEIDFDLSRTTYTYNTEKLHYVSVPVNLAIRFKNRHQFSAGGGISYMLAANNNVTKSENSSLYKTEVSQFDVKNVADGFAPVTAYLNFGYNYYITPNVTIGLNYQAGLTDVTLDSSGLFDNNNKDSNTRLAAYVRFNVF